MKDGEFWFDSSRRQAEQLEIQHQIQARPELDLGLLILCKEGMAKLGRAGEGRRPKNQGPEEVTAMGGVQKSQNQ